MIFWFKLIFNELKRKLSFFLRNDHMEIIVSIHESLHVTWWFRVIRSHIQSPRGNLEIFKTALCYYKFVSLTTHPK